MQENPIGVLTEFAQINPLTVTFFKIGDHGTGIDLGGGVEYRVSGDKPGDTAKKTKREVAYLACKEFLVRNSIKQGKNYKFTPKTPEGEKVEAYWVQRSRELAQREKERVAAIRAAFPSKVAKQFPE
jgi:hypothetical protein